MPLRVNWEELYGLQLQTTSISTAEDFKVLDSIGIGADSIFGLPITNPGVNFDPGQQIIDQKKATGVSYRRTGTGYEFQQAHRIPVTTYEWDANVYNLAGPLWLLFQGGASEGDLSPFTKTYVPYVTPACEVWSSLLRKMSASSADSHAMHGVIVRSITLSAEVGGPLKASAEFIGYDWTREFNFASAPSVLNFDAHAPVLWKDAGNVAGLYVATTETHLRGFEITITNNAVPIYYDDVKPTKFALGDFDVTGKITVPWDATTVGGNSQLANFVSGENVLLHIWWGTFASSTEADISIKTNMHYTGAEVGGDEETGTTLPFVHAYDGANNFEMKVSDDYEMEI